MKETDTIKEKYSKILENYRVNNPVFNIDYCPIKQICNLCGATVPGNELQEHIYNHTLLPPANLIYQLTLPFEVINRKIIEGAKFVKLLVLNNNLEFESLPYNGLNLPDWQKLTDIDDVPVRWSKRKQQFINSFLDFILISFFDKKENHNFGFIEQNNEIEPAITPKREMDTETKERLIEFFVQNNLIELFIPKYEYSSLEQELNLGERDELFEEAAYLMVLFQQGSTSFLQRKLKLGYNRAGRIIDQLEAAGIVGPFEGSKAREVKVATILALEQYFKYLSVSTTYDNSNYNQGSGLNENSEWNGNPRMRNELVSFFQNNYDEIIARCIKKYKLREQAETEEQDRLEKEKIKQRMMDSERKKRLHKEALAELINEGQIFKEFSKNERESISQDVIDRVWNRDGGRCVICGSKDKLEFDHIIPFSKGGAATYRNLQLLCEKCNREKSNKIG